MSEMVERVAKVLADRHQAFAASGYDWQFFVDGARDAIAAMREPTEAMVDEGEIAIFEHMAEPADWSKASTKEGWQAMIDEALK